jgi:hypothetical protein
VPLAQQHLAVAEARCASPLAVSVLDLSARSTILELAGPVLDLYACTWQGQPLWADEYVLSADEKTSIQQSVVRGYSRPCPEVVHPTGLTAS